MGWVIRILHRAGRSKTFRGPLRGLPIFIIQHEGREPQAPREPQRTGVVGEDSRGAENAA